MSKIKRRTRARQVALQFLYQLDLRGPQQIEELDAFLRETETDRETVVFARRVVRGVHEHQTKIDQILGGVAKNWQVHRMAVVDRNVLRIGAYELLHAGDVPPKVSINEAIELGKRFSTASSGSFVNGILDKVSQIAAEGGALPTTEAPESATVPQEEDAVIQAAETLDPTPFIQEDLASQEVAPMDPNDALIEED
jgi:transcription antitermination factor NusB